MAAKKRKKTDTQLIALKQIGALNEVNTQLMRRMPALEYLVENMLGNDWANCTAEHAERVGVALVKMEGHPLADKQMQMLVSEFVARALKYADARRPSKTSETVQ